MPLNGAAASDCESLESYGSSSYASGAGGAGDATPSKRMSSRKRKGKPSWDLMGFLADLLKYGGKIFSC